MSVENWEKGQAPWSRSSVEKMVRSIWEEWTAEAEKAKKAEGAKSTYYLRDDLRIAERGTKP